MSEAIQRVRGYLELRQFWCCCGYLDGWSREVVERCGFTLTLCTCDRCGLVRQNPAPTERFLERFYSSGDYRALYSPRGQAAQQAVQERVGKQAAEMLQNLGVKRLGTVYDVGCGTGGTLIGMHEMADRLIGCDLDQSFFAPETPGNVELRHGGCEVLPPGEADAVIACHTIEHRRDVLDALEEHWRLLKPGGLLILEVPCIASIGSTYRSLEAYAQLPHIWNFTARTLDMVLRATGFDAAVSRDGSVMARKSTVEPLRCSDREAAAVVAELAEHRRDQLSGAHVLEVVK